MPDGKRSVRGRNPGWGRAACLVRATAAVLAASAAGAFSGAAQAQNVAPLLPVPQAAGPVVHADRRVTFRVEASGATAVEIVPWGVATGWGIHNGLGDAAYPMKRDKDGAWTVTTPPAEPGFHYYTLRLDGAFFSDPVSPAYYGGGRFTSGIEVPEAGVDFYAVKPVPHGCLRTFWYPSALTGRERRAVVYTPPGYDADTRRRYPVLYLQHGAGESEVAWGIQGRAAQILDNLIAEGKTAAMLLVMDNGYTDPPAAEKAAPPGRGELFGDVMIRELLPAVDRAFRTRPSRDARAVAGLSMGAGQALRIGLGHPDLFGAVAAFSPGGENFDLATAYGGGFPSLRSAGKAAPLLVLADGKQDRWYAYARSMHDALTAAGIRHQWIETPEGHEWQAWRKHLHALAPLLFRTPARRAAGKR